MTYKNAALFCSLLVCLSQLAPATRAQTLIHYALHDTDSNSVAGGIIPNAGTLGNGTGSGTGISLTNDIPTNGVPPGAGNRAMVCNGAGGVLAPGTRQLNNTAIFNAGGFTYETWFKWNGAGSINAIIDYAGTQKIIHPSAQTNVQMQYYNTNNSPVSLAAGGAASNQWHYLAVVFSATNLDSHTNVTGNFAFYLDTNGVTRTASGITISPFGDSLNRTMAVGMHPLGNVSDFFNGLIYEPRVTLGALPAAGLLFEPGVVVTTTNDSGAGSLRAAVAGAPIGAAITFAPALSGQTITLTNGQIEPGNSVTIDASALANGIQLNGNGQSRIFQVDGGVTVVLNSLMIANAHSGFGGAILSSGNLIVNKCTFAGNHASSDSDGGGAIDIFTGTVIVNESTFTGNQVDTDGPSDGGGAIVNEGGMLIVNSSTFTGNHADASGFGGGGILNFGTLNLTNSILCGNTGGGVPNVGNISSGANNLLDTNALLAALGNYGGPTPTMPPLAGSPAIDAGSDAATNSFATDQRGRPRLLGAHVDIGAVEINPNTIVTNLADTGPGTLRTIIAGLVSPDLVSFATNLSGSTITLGGAIGLANNVSVDASALPGGITVNGNDADRVFTVNSGVAATLTALTITGGATSDTASGGGAILNSGTLTLTGCTIHDNFTYSGNFNDPNGGPGGAIASFGPLTLTQCTLSGNTGGGGSAIYTAAPLTLMQCTVSSNTTTGAGGAIFDGTGGALTLSNSIVAANGGSSAVDVWNLRSTSTELGSNIIQSLYNDYEGTNTGTTAINTNPQLAPLGNYGGPTLTMPPLPGSPAIDGGAATALTTDQRGYPRPIGLGPDIGAVEGIYNAAGPGRIINMTTLDNGSVEFTFTNLADANFPVVATTNVTRPMSNWVQIGFATETPPGSGHYQFTDTQAASNYPQRYYRVENH